jgi:uncharacterized protein
MLTALRRPRRVPHPGRGAALLGSCALLGTGRAAGEQAGIPAVDANQSAAFYASVFGWSIRGGVSFDDVRGHLSGFFTTGQKPSREAGLLPYIYVDHIDDALERVAGNGGEVLSAPFPEEKLWVATFRDPAGNVMGIWHHGPRWLTRG